MLNSAWPSNIWNLYDFYLSPSAAFYAAKRANRHLRAVLSLNNLSVYILLDAFADLRPQTVVVNAQIRNCSATAPLVWQTSVHLQVSGDSSTNTGIVVPNSAKTTTTYLVRLSVGYLNNNELVRNNYWLSKQPDILDYSKSNFYHTPFLQYGDYR